MKRIYPLAPMSTDIRVITAVCLAIPLMFVLLGLATPVPPAVAHTLLWTGIAVGVLYVAVWLAYRPTGFELDGDVLTIVWPLRRSRIPLSKATGVSVMTGRELRQRMGLGMRIGVGGLWGGFGWLWTTRLGLIDFYISRSDDFVLIERTDGRPLLITPVDPRAVASEIEQSLSRHAA